MIPPNLLALVPRLLQGQGMPPSPPFQNAPPPSPQNIPAPPAAVPSLPQPPNIPAPPMEPMRPQSNAFVGGSEPGVLDRLFSVIRAIGPQMYQQGEQNRQGMFDRLRQGLHIGQQPMQRSNGIGFRALPPTGLFGG